MVAITLAQQGWEVQVRVLTDLISKQTWWVQHSVAHSPNWHSVLHQVMEKAMLPPAQPSPDDRRAYSITLTARSIRTFRLAGVKLDPIIAAQGGRAGEVWINPAPVDDLQDQ